MSLAHVRRGSGPPLVLIHGIGSQWQMWQPVLDARRPRARGDRARPAGLRRVADALPARADGRGAGRLGRASSSTGSGWSARTWPATRSAAAVALELARMGAARSACALSPAGFVNDARGPLRAAPCSIGSRRRRAARSRRTPSVRARGPRAPHAHVLAPRRAAVAGPAARGGGRVRNLGALARLRGHASRRSRTSLEPGRTPSCPVTDRLGREGPAPDLLAPGAARRGGGCPSARHVTLAGCGHVPTWDDPEQVARVLLDASGN